MYLHTTLGPHKKLSDLVRFVFVKKIASDKIFMEIHHYPFSPKFFIASKVFRITLPQVRKIGSCKYEIILLEGADVVPNKSSSRSLEHDEQLVFRVKMPVRIKVSLR